MKAALVKCADYRPESLADALQRALAGLDTTQLRRAPMRTVIKPNLLTDKPPECAATTHPEVVRAVIRMLREFGHEPVVADSSASPMKMEQVWERTGFAAMCAEERVSLVNLELAGAEMFDFEGVKFSIARPLLEADLIVNVPKLKTHVLTTITNAVKNMYGTLPGLQKTALHKIFPSPAMLGRFLAYLYDILRPGFTVCDAVTAMEGNGPAGGRPVSLGFLGVSTCGVALECAVCRTLRINPLDLPYMVPPLITKDELRNAMDLPDKLTIIGDFKWESPGPGLVLPPAFIGRLIPGRLVRALRPWLWSRPEFTDACIRCGRCVEGCPTKALALPADGQPVLKPAVCIECGCCNEVCPVNAVNTRQSLLLRCARRVCAVLRGSLAQRARRQAAALHSAGVRGFTRLARLFSLLLKK